MNADLEYLIHLLQEAEDCPESEKAVKVGAYVAACEAHAVKANRPNLDGKKVAAFVKKQAAAMQRGENLRRGRPLR